MTTTTHYTAFEDERLLASGTALEVALSAREAKGQVLIFEDETGRQTDFDLRGTASEIAARAPGRPKLGVVAREVTLLPRHWDWLATQPGGASAALRRLVDEARTRPNPRAAQQAADRFMMAMLGNQPGYEEASRALYAGNAQRFTELTEPWPTDLRTHARKLAAGAFYSTKET